MYPKRAKKSMNILDLIFPKSCLECGRSGGYICEACLAKVGRGRTSRYSISLFKYEGVIRKAIIALKYKFAFDIAKELAEACVSKIRSSPYLLVPNACLVPIPLHKTRQNWRGFNQAEEVGKLLADKLGWKFEPNLLLRKTSGKPQVGLKGKARHENIKDVFEVNTNIQKNIGKSTVLVFDDVYTTGSTMREAIKTLSKRGFKRVFGLTIAS